MSIPSLQPTGAIPSWVVASGCHARRLAGAPAAELPRSAAKVEAPMDDFWAEYIDDESTGPALTDEMVRAAERTLGCKLPEPYLRLLRIRNGGYPRRECFPAPDPDWGEDHIQVQTIRGLGYAGGADGSLRFTLDNPGRALGNWARPPGPVTFADTPSGGHDFFVLDYRECGPRGQPRVTHVDTEGALIMEIIAPDFETFARGLVDCPEDDEDDDSDDTAVPARRPWWRFW